MSYKKFDLDYSDIPSASMQDGGGIVVCKDLHHRLGWKSTWAVVRTHANKEALPTPLGLFWDVEMAERFAGGLTRECLYKFHDEAFLHKLNTQRLLALFKRVRSDVGIARAAVGTIRSIDHILVDASADDQSEFVDKLRQYKRKIKTILDSREHIVGVGQ